MKTLTICNFFPTIYRLRLCPSHLAFHFWWSFCYFFSLFIIESGGKFLIIFRHLNVNNYSKMGGWVWNNIEFKGVGIINCWRAYWWVSSARPQPWLNSHIPQYIFLILPFSRLKGYWAPSSFFFCSHFRFPIYFFIPVLSIFPSRFELRNHPGTQLEKTLSRP